MKILRFIGYGVLLIIVAIALFFFSMRFSDGPMEMFAGGPFTSGQLYSGPEPDWRFLRDRPTVEFQLEDPARSRTTWIIEYNGKIYIPSGYMNSTMGKLWKQWPIEAEENGRAILRVDDKLYQRQLVRLKSVPEVADIVKLLLEKYKIPNSLEEAIEAVDSDALWLFEMAPRA